jgi:hypothetical protein
VVATVGRYTSRRYYVPANETTRALAWWLHRFPGQHIRLQAGSAYGLRSNRVRPVAETMTGAAATTVLVRTPCGEVVQATSAGMTHGGLAVYDLPVEAEAQEVA